MAYCTVADIQVYLTNFTINDTSKPTTAQITSMCANASENIIDPFLTSLGFTVPIVAGTNPMGYAYVKQWAINCVLSSVYRAIEAEPELSKTYDDKCRKAMDDVRDDPSLVEYPSPSDDDTPQAGGSTRPDIKWKRGEEQW